MKTNIPKEPFPLRALKWYYPKLELIAPALAYNLAYKLFFSPIRFKRPPRELETFTKAKKYKVKLANHPVQLYEWGAKGTPVAVVVHGWSGRATQLYAFVQPLVQLGYHVVGFDAPAHGASEGKQTNIKEFFEILNHIHVNIGKIAWGIGHSFGGVALLYAIHEGLPIQQVVMISSPTIGDDILAGFSKKINASPNTGKALRKLVLNRFNLDFETITACHLITKINLNNLLIIHDKNDEEVPYQNAIALHQRAPGSSLLLTQTLGHTRILRAPQVVEATLNFIKKINYTKGV